MIKFDKVTLPGVRCIIAVVSGKGGVGKSTVAANLSLSFSQNGFKTALLDADLYGPSVPTLFGLEGKRADVNQIDGKNRLIPLEKAGIKLMSAGFLYDPEQALIWRGPLASSTLMQLFTETHWGEIDFLVVDLPPGTGDIPLTLCQQIKPDGAVVVTTPQKLSLADVQKAISMLKNVVLDIPVWGIIENMSWFIPDDSPSKKYPLFGEGGGRMLAEYFGAELLAQIPLVEGMSESADRGDFFAYRQSKMIQDIYKDVMTKIVTKSGNYEK